MTHHDAFLQSIIDTPDDDTRLSKDDPRREKPEARERELLARVAGQWVGGWLEQFLASG